MPDYVVTLARDLTEYTSVTVTADDEDAAEELALDVFEARGEGLTWTAGGDREHVYVSDSKRSDAR